MSKFWEGTPPTRCEIGGEPIGKRFYDARTNQGWGKLCPSCFAEHGNGLGLGRGQLYERQPDGRFLKIGG